MVITLLFLAGALVLGAGLLVPAATKAADERRKTAQQEAKRRAKQARRAHRRDEEAAQRAQDAAEQEQKAELAAIRADPHSHLYQLMLGALRQRIIARRAQQAAAAEQLQRATADHTRQVAQLQAFETANRWVANGTTRKVVTLLAWLAIPVFALVLMLDLLITRAVFDGVVGYLLAPAAILLIGLGTTAACWGLALFDTSGKAFATPARGVAVTGGALVFVGVVALMMLWAPARTAAVYDPQIGKAQLTLAELERDPAQGPDQQAKIQWAKQQVDTLEQTKQRLQGYDQVFVGVSSLAEGAVVEAVTLATLIRRRDELQAQIDDADAATRAAHDQTAALDTAIRTDVAQIAERMVGDQVRAGIPLDAARQNIADTLPLQGDLTFFTRLLTGQDPTEPPVADSAGVHAPSDHPVVRGEVIPDDPASDGIDEPAPPIPGSGGIPGDPPGTVNPPTMTEEIPMPQPRTAGVDLDRLDQSS